MPASKPRPIDARDPGGTRDWRERLESALLQLHQTTDTEGTWRAMVRLIRLALPCEAVVALLPSAESLGLELKSTLPRQELEAFTKLWNPESPLLSGMLAGESGSDLAVLDIHALGPEARESLVCRDLASPNGWRHTLGLFFREGNELTAQVEICRTAGQGRFSAEEMQRLRGLHSSIGAAVTRVALIARQAAAVSMMAEALEHPYDGLALLDIRGRVIFQNHAAVVACSIWERGHAAAAEQLDAREPVGLPQDLAGAARELLSGFPGEEGPVGFRKALQPEREFVHPEGFPVRAKLRVIVPKRGTGPPHVRVDFFRLLKKPAVPSVRDHAFFRLTRGEHRVASLVARGLRNSEVAAELGVSVNTVRAHLREIFCKLGVSHRGELARSLAEAADFDTR